LTHFIQEEVRITGSGGGGGVAGPAADENAPEEVQPEPLDMAFPKGGVRKQITYLILFPIIFPLWLTLPDTRSPSCKFSFYKTPLTNHFSFFLFFAFLSSP